MDEFMDETTKFCQKMFLSDRVVGFQILTTINNTIQRVGISLFKHACPATVCLEIWLLITLH